MTHPILRAARPAVDAAMTVGLLFQMGFPFWGDAAHEWVGAGLYVLFVLHHLLNLGFWKGLLRGRYGVGRVLLVTVDLLALLAMLGLMVSGVLLSREVFAFLPLSGHAAFARLLHMASAYWGFVLMAAHLGLHWTMVLALGRRTLRLQEPSRRRTWALNLAGGAVALWGLAAFVRRELPRYMLLRTEFVFFDYSEPPVRFYLDYLAMMGLFLFLLHHGAKALRARPSKGGHR